MAEKNVWINLKKTSLSASQLLLKGEKNAKSPLLGFLHTAERVKGDQTTKTENDICTNIV